MYMPSSNDSIVNAVLVVALWYNNTNKTAFISFCDRGYRTFSASVVIAHLLLSTVMIPFVG